MIRNKSRPPLFADDVQPVPVKHQPAILRNCHDGGGRKVGKADALHGQFLGTLRDRRHAGGRHVVVDIVLRSFQFLLNHLDRLLFGIDQQWVVEEIKVGRVLAIATPQKHAANGFSGGVTATLQH